MRRRLISVAIFALCSLVNEAARLKPPNVNPRIGPQRILLEEGKCANISNCQKREDHPFGFEENSRPCYCDQRCQQFDDCCPNSADLDERAKLGAKKLRAMRSQWHCQRINPVYGDVLMRSSCPSDWLQNSPANKSRLAELVQRRCEQTKDQEKRSELQYDPIGMLMPITDLSSGITYANSYCLRCNRPKREAKLIYWSPLLECSYNLDKDDRNTLYDLISTNKGRALHYSAKTNRWMIKTSRKSNGTNNEPSCTISPSIPEPAEQFIRHCRAETIDSCPPRNSDEPKMARARLECEIGRQSLVYLMSSNSVYYNLGCAQCNNQDTWQFMFSCEPNQPTNTSYGVYSISSIGDNQEAAPGRDVQGRVQPNQPAQGSLTILLDLKVSSQGDEEEEEVGVVHQCPGEAKQIYDSILDTCLQVYCDDDKQYVDTKCVGLPNATEISELDSTSNMKQQDEPARSHSVGDDSQSATIPTVVSSTGRSLVGVTLSSLTSTTDKLSIKADSNISADEASSIFKLKPNVSEPISESRRKLSECGKIKIQQEHFKLFEPVNSTHLQQASAKSDTQLFAFIEPYNLTLAEGQFELVREKSSQLSLLVCSPFATDLVAKFRPAMVYVTDVGLAISMASLALYLLLYGLSMVDLRRMKTEAAQWAAERNNSSAGELDSKEAQNDSRASRGSAECASLAASHHSLARNQSLSSRGVACLSGSLLAAYLLFLLGHQKLDWLSGEGTGKPAFGCKLIAASTYFCFLIAFNWMFLLSYDIWRTLRLATCQLRGPAQHAQSRRFLTYTTFAIIAAGLLVALALIADHLPATCPIPTANCSAAAAQFDRFVRSYKPKFGSQSGSCWFSNRRSLGLFFGAPVTLIMFANLFFFLLSSFMVLRTSSRSSRHLAAEQRSRPRADLNNQSGDFTEQNGLTTSSLASMQTIQSTLSGASSMDSSESCADESPPIATSPPSPPAPPPPPPPVGANSISGRKKLGPSLSSSSLTNQSLGGVSIATSLALKCDAQLQSIQSLVGSLAKDYRLYCRLCTIMGLTWLTGLLASLVDASEPLWYLFVVLNTLQGLFIFIAFGCKRSKLANAKILFDYSRFGLERFGRKLSSSQGKANISM